jgi:hypothetical protein
MKTVLSTLAALGVVASLAAPALADVDARSFFDSADRARYNVDAGKFFSEQDRNHYNVDAGRLFGDLQRDGR